MGDPIDAADASVPDMSVIPFEGALVIALPHSALSLPTQARATLRASTLSEGGVLEWVEASWRVIEGATFVRVDERGELTTLAPGQATVTASYRGATASAAVTVTDEIGAVSLSPTPSLRLWPGERRRVGLIAVDGRDDHLAPYAFWQTSDERVVRVSMRPGHEGEIEAVGPGTARIGAMIGGASHQMIVRVEGEATARALSIEGAPEALITQLNHPMRARIVYGDGSWLDVSDQSAWEASGAGATIDARGELMAANAGTARVIARYGAQEAAAPVAIIDREVAQTSLSVDRIELPVGAHRDVSVSATDAAGRRVAASAIASWRSQDTQVATVDARGRVVGHGVGEAQVVARVGEREASMIVVVMERDTATEIAIEPAAPVVGVGAAIDLRLMGHSARGGAEYTDSAQWKSSNHEVSRFVEGAQGRGLRGHGARHERGDGDPRRRARCGHDSRDGGRARGSLCEPLACGDGRGDGRAPHGARALGRRDRGKRHRRDALARV